MATYKKLESSLVNWIVKWMMKEKVDMTSSEFKKLRRKAQSVMSQAMIKYALLRE